MKKRGFTLIEMLIVIIIIGILAATLIPRIGNARDRANDVARVADVKSLSTALTSFGLDYPYPATQNGVCKGGAADQKSSESGLLNADYGLGGILPQDPTTKLCYDYKKLGSDHFVICAILSSATSNNGNASKNIAKESASTYDAAIALMDGAGQYYCYVG